MQGINRVILVGHLGQDPEVRALPSGGVVSTFSLATHRRWKDQAGQPQEETEWHKVAVFGRSAEVARDYLKKGRAVYVEGRIRTREWQDKDGQKRYFTEVVADSFQMLDGRTGEAASPGRGPVVAAASAAVSLADVPF